MLEKAHNKFIDLEENYDFHYELYQETLNNPLYENSSQLAERRTKIKSLQQVIINIY